MLHKATRRTLAPDPAFTAGFRSRTFLSGTPNQAQALADARTRRHATRRADSDAQQPPIGYRRGPSEQHDGVQRSASLSGQAQKLNCTNLPAPCQRIIRAVIPRTTHASTADARPPKRPFEHTATQKIPPHGLSRSTDGQEFCIVPAVVVLHTRCSWTYECYCHWHPQAGLLGVGELERPI